MTEIFFLKLALSFIVGSVWISTATILAEKFGTKVGGILAGLPSTMVVALFFIGWTQTPQIAAEAATVVPIIMGIDAVFIVVYVGCSVRSGRLRTAANAPNRHRNHRRNR